MISLLVLIFFGILIIIFVNNLKKPETKGNYGEIKVSKKLDTISKEKYILNNIYINDNGKSRQIDHIVITNSGVFVIETKNFGGKIYGKESSNEWIQYIGKKGFNFKNPIHQNYGHVQAIEKILNDDSININSIIAFTRRAILKVKTYTRVLYPDEIVKYISNMNGYLKKDKMKEIYDKINENKIVDPKVIKNHKDNVRHYVQYKEQIAESGKCPRCGNDLIKRNSVNGQFYGCKSFPKCRYTKNI